MMRIFAKASQTNERRLVAADNMQPNLVGDVASTREKEVVTREKTREKILLLMKVSPKITTSQMAEKLGISPKGVEWQISKLKADGSIRRIGPDNGGHWEVMM